MMTLLPASMASAGVRTHPSSCQTSLAAMPWAQARRVVSRAYPPLFTAAPKPDGWHTLQRSAFISLMRNGSPAEVAAGLMHLVSHSQYQATGELGSQALVVLSARSDPAADACWSAAKERLEADAGHLLRNALARQDHEGACAAIQLNPGCVEPRTLKALECMPAVACLALMSNRDLAQGLSDDGFRRTAFAPLVSAGQQRLQPLSFSAISTVTDIVKAYPERLGAALSILPLERSTLDAVMASALPADIPKSLWLTMAPHPGLYRRVMKACPERINADLIDVLSDRGDVNLIKLAGQLNLSAMSEFMQRQLESSSTNADR